MTEIPASATPASTLVLMACSGAKLPHADQPLRLYLGPMWQTLRLHRGTMPWRNVFVLSGRFGFIGAQHFIQTYDERLTAEKADRMIAGGIFAPNDHHGACPPHGAGTRPADVVRPYAHKDRPPFGLVLSAGAGDYRRVFEAFVLQFRQAGIVAQDAPVLQVEGGIGEQRSQLGRWLRMLSAGGIVGSDPSERTSRRTA